MLKPPVSRGLTPSRKRSTVVRDWALLDEEGCWEVALHNPLRLIGLTPADIRPLVDVRLNRATARFDVHRDG